MGLGKTVQVIALMLAIANDRAARGATGGANGGAARAGAGGRGGAPRHCHLVVAPASVLDNWHREFLNWAPSLRVAKYHGPQAERLLLQGTLDASRFDVLLTTYSYFEGDSQAGSADRKWLNKRQVG